MISSWIRTRRRQRVKARPFPSAWEGLLHDSVPLSRRLSQADLAELKGHVAVFLAEKHFEGCGGASIDDEVRVTVAGNACLLLLRRETDYYPGVDSVLIYPEEFVATVIEETEYGVVEERTEARAGETSAEGAVVLSWDDVRYDVEHPEDGENVILHEFAHQLDEESGFCDGAPLLGARADYAQWARVFRSEYERLGADSRAGRRTVMDEYGATDPAEFFAVATECFFETPVAMHARHRELYAELVGFYRRDPVAEGAFGKEGSHAG